MSETKNYHIDLLAVNVNEHTEKKQNLTYLSWAWAWAEVIKRDVTANYAFLPPQKFGETLMIFCDVTIFCKSITAYLPVMNHSNKAIANPDAVEVNKAMMRCLAKGIALHGLGLYIYAGEDLPEEYTKAEQKQPAKPPLAEVKQKAIDDAKLETYQNQMVNAFAEKMEKEKGDIEKFRAWYKENLSEILKECGPAGAKKVEAAWIATGKGLTK